MGPLGTGRTFGHCLLRDSCFFRRAERAPGGDDGQAISPDVCFAVLACLRAAADACSIRVGMGRSFSIASTHPHRHSAQTSSRVTTIVTQCFVGVSFTICGRTLDSAASGEEPLLPPPVRPIDKERRKRRLLTSSTRRRCVWRLFGEPPGRPFSIAGPRTHWRLPRMKAEKQRDPPHLLVPATSERRPS